MQLTRGLITIGALALAGCNLSTDLTVPKRVGSITVDQFGGADTAMLDVTAFFFEPARNEQVPLLTSVGAPDRCEEIDYVPPEMDPPLRHLNSINAGASIAMTTDKADTTLLPVTNSAGTVVYVVPGGGLIPFTAGSNITFDIPGDPSGYPAKTIEQPTLQPMTLAPVERRPTEELHLTWSPAGSPVGAVTLQFLYSTDSTTSPDKALLCILRDDGEFDIDRFRIVGWADSPAEAQSIMGMRWTGSIQTNDDVVLNVVIRTQIDPPTLVEE